MPALSQQDEKAMDAATIENRRNFPPLLMAGIGQFQAALVPSIYGGLTAINSNSQSVGTLPEVLAGFDVAMPAFQASGMYPEGILPDIINNSVVILQSGLYYAVVSVVATVDAVTEYTVAVHVNGVPTDASTSADLSGDAALFAGMVGYPLNLSAGDIVAVYGSADVGGSQFDILTGLFFLTRTR